MFKSHLHQGALVLTKLELLYLYIQYI